MNALSPLTLVLAALLMPATAPAQDRSTTKATKVAAAKSPAADVPAVPVEPLSAADGEQMLAASMVYIGSYVCEYGQMMTVSRSSGHDGYIEASIAKRSAIFKPVRSSTGAIRLEEVNSGALLLVQIPSKTILMDTHAGKRLVDGCQHDEQKKAAIAAARNDNTLGINAPGQIAVKGVAAGQ
jgi:hypothetical protein